ncbi:MAG TPA: biotin transporter BioY [Chthonomonadaceae bacterium]|nr:biotin transporter BioY [Chthonomonadaceae bacterium]
MPMGSSSIGTRANAESIGRVLACTALTALGARLAVRLPFTPVPATWQVAAVLFSGLLLGARGAFASQALYLLAGLAGAPVFAFGNGGAPYLFNPFGTGGYLLSYPLAAWLVGFLAEKYRSESRAAPFLACGSGLAVIYGIGCLWLGLWLHLSPLQALVRGAGWFFAWDAVKALIAILGAHWAKGGGANPWQSKEKRAS